METKRRWAGCTQKGNPLPFVTAIVASNSGDLGQGRVRCSNTSASRLLPVSAAYADDLYEKRRSYEDYRNYQ